jgi:hypothetical protein
MTLLGIDAGMAAKFEGQSADNDGLRPRGMSGEFIALINNAGDALLLACV